MDFHWLGLNDRPLKHQFYTALLRERCRAFLCALRNGGNMKIKKSTPTENKVTKQVSLPATIKSLLRLVAKSVAARLAQPAYQESATNSRLSKPDEQESCNPREAV